MRLPVMGEFADDSISDRGECRLGTVSRIDPTALAVRARRVIPNGVSSGGRASYTDLIVRTKGAHVWNSAGRRYIDHLLAWGAIVVGHCDPRVNEAVARAVATCDLNWVGTQAGELELAETITEVMPSAEKVAFCTSGTDATMHAAQLVRAATGRRKLVKFHGSYHGWHDSLAVGARFSYGTTGAAELESPNSAGLHPDAAADVMVIEWNDFDGVRGVFTNWGPEIAAVFCEPYVHSYGCVAAEAGFLELLRDLTIRHDAVLVFDEMKTGFRSHIGGYQAICGVTPDLTTFGKALGNGYTIAGIAGRAALMDLFGAGSDEKVTLDGTFNASPYAVAAANAVVSILRDGGVARLDELGRRLRWGVQKAISEAGVDAVVTGLGSEWAVYFRSDAPRNYREAVAEDDERHAAYSAALHDRGVLEPPFTLGDRRLCMATTEADIDETAEAYAAAFQLVAKGRPTYR